VLFVFVVMDDIVVYVGIYSVLIVVEYLKMNPDQNNQYDHIPMLDDVQLNLIQYL
jgi:hypothetical protein